MIKDFGVSKPTMILKTSIANIINKYQKFKTSSLSLHFSKNCFKTKNKYVAEQGKALNCGKVLCLRKNI